MFTPHLRSQDLPPLWWYTIVHIVLNPSSVLSRQQKGCTANTSPQCTHRAVSSSSSSSIRGGKKRRWKCFMWCSVAFLSNSARSSKQIYVAYWTQNVTSVGRIWGKGFILSSLSFRSVKGARFWIFCYSCGCRVSPCVVIFTTCVPHHLVWRKGPQTVNSHHQTARQNQIYFKWPASTSNPRAAERK